MSYDPKREARAIKEEAQRGLREVCRLYWYNFAPRGSNDQRRNRKRARQTGQHPANPRRRR